MSTGTFRMVRKSIRFGLRSRKRLLVFICIFSFLSGVTLLAVQNLEAENKENLLTEKAIRVKQSGWNSVQYTAASSMIDSIGENTHTSKVYVTRYINIGGNLRIFSLDTRNPWANNLVKPNDIIKGHFIQGYSQVLLSSDYSLTIGDFDYIPAIGSKIDFTAVSGSAIPLNVVGKFDKPAADVSDNAMWMILKDDLFDEILLTLSTNTVYVYEMIIVAKGSTILNFLFPDAYIHVDGLETYLPTVLGGGWSSPEVPQTTARRSERGLKQMFLAFGIIGGVIVATMYGFLISRFRTREIAILKAIGYTAGSVRIVLLGEIFTVSILGFILAAVLIQGGMYGNAALIQTVYVENLLFSTTALLSFVIIILSNLLGLVIISKRSVSVRPMELFRGDR
ncbi:MAG: hypothetical protein ACTSP4_07270 [Candidatus Hodarchaeales archaeon]